MWLSLEYLQGTNFKETRELGKSLGNTNSKAYSCAV
jgi:hypothetical protein